MLQRTTLLGLFLFGSLIAAFPAGVWGFVQLDDRTLGGVRVEGIQVPAGDDPAAAVSEIAQAWLDEEVTVQVENDVLTATRGELGVRVDVDATVRRVRAAGHSGDVISDLAAIIAARRGHLDIALPRSVDAEAAATFLELATPFVEGQIADDAGTLLSSAAVAGVTEHVVTVEPAPEPEVPTGVALETSLASFSTRYHTGGRHRGRAHNVEQAAANLDGAIIPPHGTLSFNGVVGPRDRENGFRRAMVIDGGQLVPGMGGGVCQVASTLHAAALEGGLEMGEYRPHSRPSGYIAMGLDATVSYPQIDLTVENPFDFPVLVQSHAVDGEMHVDLIGQARPREVEIARRVLNRRGYAQRVVEDIYGAIQLLPGDGEGRRQSQDAAHSGFETQAVTQAAVHNGICEFAGLCGAFSMLQ